MDIHDLKNISIAFFRKKKCNHETICNFIKEFNVLAAFGINFEEAYNLIEKSNIVVHDGLSGIIEDNEDDHEDWFNAQLNVGIRRDIDFKIYENHSEYLSVLKGRNDTIIESVHKSTNLILSRLEDPLRDGAWDRRGMVFGNVQSGKTGHYTALIAKAMDAGYKIIIVLTGVHNSLRAQTQDRFNEELLGYDLDKTDMEESIKKSGIRALKKDHPRIDTKTSSNEKNGDFQKHDIRSGIPPDASGSPCILIIKKHASIIENVIKWATSYDAKLDSKGRKVVDNIPLLVVDDECDYASVNTKKSTNQDGSFDPDIDPTKINLRIRELLSVFAKKAYIGYTATPYANIFVRQDAPHNIYGQDIFPRSFIISLEQNPNYFGPEKLFGLAAESAFGVTEKQGLPDLIKPALDVNEENIIPDKHKSDFIPSGIPRPLKLAIKSYLIAACIREFRNVRPYHNTMLIHVTRYTAVQECIKNYVEDEVNLLIGRLRDKNDTLADFREIFENDFIKTSLKIKDSYSYKIPTWDQIKENLYEFTRRVQIKQINGSVGDCLSYKEKDFEAEKNAENGINLNWFDKGAHIIAIGGDKLSRGLTLEGLVTSYYLRASKTYDTLMQMGRWFGYRDGYEDICRLYTTPSLIRAYQRISTANLLLRMDLHEMEGMPGANPKTFGLKVRQDPEQMQITSYGKYRDSEIWDISYSGKAPQTINFDLTKSEQNTKNLLSFVEILENSPDAQLIDTESSNGNLYYRTEGSDLVIEFLDGYKADKEVRSANPDNIKQFIKLQKNKPSDLNIWDIVIISRRGEGDEIILGNHKIGLAERSAVDISENSLVLKQIASPTDEQIDYSKEDKKKLIEEYMLYRKSIGKPLGEDWKGTVSGNFVRKRRDTNKGLLLISILCSKEKDGTHAFGHTEGQRVIGYQIVFPESDTTDSCEFRITSSFKGEEYDI